MMNIAIAKRGVSQSTKITRKEKKRLKRAPKHADRSVTICQVGRQLFENSKPYSHGELARRFTADELSDNSVRAITRRGTTTQQKAHAKKMAVQEKELRRKKLSKEGYSPITLEEYKAESEQMKMAYDEQWVRERSAEAIVDQKIDELVKPAFWSKLTIGDGFFKEIEDVLPHYWEMVTKKSRGKKISKKAVMKGGPPLGLKPLPSYLEILMKLSRGELEGTLANMKQITSVSHARELKRAKITGATYFWT